MANECVWHNRKRQRLRKKRLWCEKERKGEKEATAAKDEAVCFELVIQL